MRDTVWYTLEGEDPVEFEVLSVIIENAQGRKTVSSDRVFTTEAEAREAAARYWDSKELNSRLHADNHADRASKLRKGEKRPIPIVGEA